VGEKDGITMAKKLDELSEDVFYGGLSSHRRISEAVNALNFWRNGYVRIYELFESGELATVQSKAHGVDFHQLVHHGVETGGFGVEGEKRYLREPSLVLPHCSSHPWLASDHKVGGTASRLSLS
jgi:hypothetical protein